MSQNPYPKWPVFRRSIVAAFQRSLTLYARGLLSFGKASELAGISRVAFADVVAQRDIHRHYTQEELNEDTAYAGGQ